MLQLRSTALPQLHPDRDGRDGLLPGQVPPVWTCAPRQVGGQELQQEAILQEEWAARKAGPTDVHYT